MLRSRRVRSGPGMKSIFLDDFSGGLNFLDPPMALAGNQTQDALNVHSIGKTLMKRTGAATNITLANAGKYVFQTSVLNYLIVQRGAGLYAYNPGSDTLQHTLIASGLTGKVACADFTGLLVIVSNLGIHTWAGSGSATNRTSFFGSDRASIAVWQNKVWVSIANTLYWCAAGDATTWNTSTDFVRIREPDDEFIEAIGVGNGIDVSGRDGLLVFKSNSGHRVIDNDTGEYVTLWTNKGGGAISHESVAAVNGVVYFQNVLGMWRLRGDTPERISAPIDPVGQYTYSGDDQVNCVFGFGGRVMFSRASASTIWEYVPETGAWWRHSLYNGSTFGHAVSVAPPSPGTNRELVYMLAGNDTTKILLWYPGDGDGSDPGRDFAASTLPCNYATPWASFGLDRAMVRRALIEGWGVNVALSTKSDYQGALTSFDTDLDFATLSASVFSGALERFELGRHRALSLYFAESSGTTGPFGPINKSTLDPVDQYLQGFGLNALRLDYVPIGRV